MSTLRRELRWLDVLHTKVLNPTVVHTARIGRPNADPGLLEALCHLQSAVVLQCDDHQPEAYVFDPEDVRAIVLAADSIRERLVTMLFLTTGMRRGGVARLRGPDVIPTHADDVPKQLSTCEKHNRVRFVTLTPTVRILVAQCGVCAFRRHTHGRYALGRSRSAATNYVFPGRSGGGHIEESVVARICGTVFRKAGVAGRPQAHTHTFRHTFIKMLWRVERIMLGCKHFPCCSVTLL